MASCSHRGLQQLRQLWNIVAMHRTTTNVAVTRPPDRILPVAVPQSGLAPPCTQRRLGSGRLKMYVYANLNGLELPDRAQRRCEDQRICRWRGPPSRSSRPIALGSSVPWSFRLSLSLDPPVALLCGPQLSRPRQPTGRPQENDHEPKSPAAGRPGGAVGGYVIKAPITIPRYPCICCNCQQHDQMGALVKGFSPSESRPSYETRPSDVGRLGPSRPAT